MNFLKRNNVNKNKRKSIKINPIIKRTALTILTLIIVCSAYSNRAVFARPIEFVAKNIAKVAVYSVLPAAGRAAVKLIEITDAADIVGLKYRRVSKIHVDVVVSAKGVQHIEHRIVCGSLVLRRR